MGSNTSKLQNQLFEQALQGHKDFFQTLQLLCKEVEKPEADLIPVLTFEKNPNPLYQKDSLLHTACRFAPPHYFHQDSANKGQTFSNKLNIIKYLLVDKRYFSDIINTPSPSSGLRPIDYACHLEGVAFGGGSDNSGLRGMNFIFDEEKNELVPMPPDIILLLILEGADFNHLNASVFSAQTTTSSSSPPMEPKHPFTQAESYQSITEKESHAAGSGQSSRKDHTILVGASPLMLACRSCFVSGIIELVGRGADGNVSSSESHSTPLTELLENRYQADEINLVRALEALLPVLPKSFLSKPVRITYKEQRNITASPFELAVVCRPSTTSEKDHRALITFLITNNVNFYNELGSYLWLQTDSRNQNSNKKLSPRLPGYVISIYLENIKKHEASSTRKSSFIEELFLKPPPSSVYDRSHLQEHPNECADNVPFQYTWRFDYMNWNWSVQYGRAVMEKNEPAEIYHEIGRSSPVAASILLMKFELFKLVVKQCGFGSLLKPIRLRSSDDVATPLLVTLPYQRKKGSVVEQIPMRVSIVPIYLLFMVERPLTLAADWLDWIFQNCPDDFKKEFSCLKDYAEAIEYDWKPCNHTNLDYSDWNSADHSHIPERYLRCAYDFTQHSAENLHMRLAKEDFNFITHMSFTISSPIVFKMFYYCCKKDFNSFVTSFSFHTRATSQHVIDILSVYTNLSSIQVIGTECVSLETFAAIANYSSSNGGTAGLKSLSFVTTYEKVSNVEGFTQDHFAILMKSEILQNSLVSIQTHHFDFLFEPYHGATTEEEKSKPFLELFMETFSQMKLRIMISDFGAETDSKRMNMWKNFQLENMAANPNINKLSLWVANKQLSKLV